MQSTIFFCEETFQFPFHIRVHKRWNISLGDDHDILRGCEPGFIQSKKLSYESFDSISFNGITHFLADRDPQPIDSQFITAHNNNKTVRIAPYPLLIYPQIVFGFPNSLSFRESLLCHDVRTMPSRRFMKYLRLLPIPMACYTVRRFLPFARLRLKTCLPALVDMRRRKPCVLFLFILLTTVRFFFMSRPNQYSKVSH
jgi:hypothetical protein